MKLAILVVYRLTDDLLPLLDLHLARIARHTTVPYTLYGAAVSLGEGARQRLSAQPHVVLPELVGTTATDKHEHAHYLEQLTQLAFDHGADHVVTLHLDSFPIADGWVETLLSLLSPRCPLVTLTRGSTACLLVERDFYLARRPPYLLPDDVLAEADCQAFLRAVNAPAHSGAGLLYATHQAGLEFRELPDTTVPGQPTWRARVFGDVLFHWAAAVRQPPVGPSTATAAAPEALAATARTLLPASWRRALRHLLAPLLHRHLDLPRQQAHEAWVAGTYARMMADPEAFIERQRGGR
ncbi:MAG: hypothetical protein HZB16_08075 [Armatimonadetes bacterium]|nr:hypothetical protein [Armatimonadota bacterium]